MHVQTYTIDQLAVLFQRSAATLRNYLEQLQAEHGFPPKLPCFDNLWSKPAVDRWIENNGRAGAEPVMTLQHEPVTILEAKYGAP